tara:strand:- start:627 stop:815 length:189 start_codon:yes stop_codon:yes gene_type:complete
MGKALNAPTDEKGTRYIMVNVDEGNPSFHIDRNVIRGASHQVRQVCLLAAIPSGQIKPFRRV